MEYTLVEYSEHNAPVVFEGKVYQCSLLDWDGELVLKDDINGVKLFKGDPEQHMVKVKQIAINGHIQFGSTADLQKIVNENRLYRASDALSPEAEYNQYPF